jgi:hypothetical protein
MCASIIYFSILCLALFSAHGLALDHQESATDDSHPSPDLFVRASFTPARRATSSQARRSPTALKFDNTGPIADSKPTAANFKRTPSPSTDDIADGEPTPAPTGKSSPRTTVHINDKGDFALLLPKTPHG